MHHASSCRSKKKVSNFFSAQNFVLIDYKLTIIDYTSVFSLQRSFSYRFNQLQANCNQLHNSVETMIDFLGVSALIHLQVIIIDYFSLKSVPISGQEHFNQLHQESN